MELLLGYAALIGDVARSRAQPLRGDLQTLLEGALAHTNKRVTSLQPLEITIGDEFQGLYEDVASALEASLWIRLSLMRGSTVHGDVRFGVGWGGLVVLDSTRVPFAQDGPAWWTAREALKTAAHEARRSGGPKGLRTCFLSFERMFRDASRSDKARWQELQPIYEEPALGKPRRLRSEADDLVNAYLLCRDQLVSSLGPKEAASLMELMVGRSQADIAARERVSQSAISQRLARSGAYAIRAAEELMRTALAG